MHWLPVNQRIDFKILILVYKALHNLIPSNISDCLRRYIPNWILRSSSAGLFTSFYHYAPKMWNCLPNEVKESSSIHIFKKCVKTYLFKVAYEQFMKCLYFSLFYDFFMYLFILFCVYFVSFSLLYLLILVEPFQVLIVLCLCCFNICFMLVELIGLPFMYEKCYTNKLLLLYECSLCEQNIYIYIYFWKI